MKNSTSSASKITPMHRRLQSAGARHDVRPGTLTSGRSGGSGGGGGDIERIARIEVQLEGVQKDVIELLDIKKKLFSLKSLLTFAGLLIFIFGALWTFQSSIVGRIDDGRTSLEGRIDDVRSEVNSVENANIRIEEQLSVLRTDYSGIVDTLGAIEESNSTIQQSILTIQAQ